MLMTGNVTLCCMVLPLLGFVLHGCKLFQHFVLSCCFWQDCDGCVLQSALLSRAPRFRGEVVCPVVKDLICLSELLLIPILNHSEQSAVTEVF